MTESTRALAVQCRGLTKTYGNANAGLFDGCSLAGQQ